RPRSVVDEEFKAMAIPDYQSLMLAVLRIAAGGEARVLDAEQRLAEEFRLTTEERNQLLPSGKLRVLHNRIHWAKFYLSKAGLTTSIGRGRFMATETGRALLASNPDRIDVKRLLSYPSFQEFYRGNQMSTQGSSLLPDSSPSSTSDLSPASGTPEEQIESAQAAMHAALRADLLQRIWANSPIFFEELIIELLVQMGYGGSRISAASHLGRTRRGGVDGVINEDRLGLDRVYVQAKRYAPSNTVGRPEVQGFVGSLVGLGAAKGVLVTTSTFSPQAIEFVKHLPQRVVLIDGSRLADLM